MPVRRKQSRDAEIEYLLERIFLGRRRDVRVQAMDGLTQAEGEYDLLIVLLPSGAMSGP